MSSLVMSDLIWLLIAPFGAALFLALLPRRLEKEITFLALASSLFPLALVLKGELLGQSLSYEWFPGLGTHFALGVDSLSLLFLGLVVCIIPICLGLVAQKKPNYLKELMSLILVVEGMLIGFFTAKDLALFVFFWEAMLLPLYFMISIWGRAESQKTAMRFLIYMFAGSVFIIAATLSLYFTCSLTFDMQALGPLAQKSKYAHLIFGAFMLAFAVKTPLFPFHSWLPETYCQSSSSSTILLSAVLSKAGVYGIFRIGYELFPVSYREWSFILIALAVAGTFYGALAALKEKDFKRILAYTSLSHIQFLLVGIFIASQYAFIGAWMQVVNHALTITALFVVCSLLEKRLGSTALAGAKGLAKTWPKLCWLSLFFVMSAIGLPGLNNFVGEFILFYGVFNYSYSLAALLAFSIVLGAAYLLRWVRKIYFGDSLGRIYAYRDLGIKEGLLVLPLVVLILILGIYPAPLIKHIETIVPRAAHITATIDSGKAV